MISRQRQLRVGLGLCVALACASPEGPEPEASLPVDPYDRLRARAVEVRGLEFIEPVPIREVTREEVREIVRFELEESQPADYADGSRDAYATLGVLPVDLNLIDAWLGIHQEELIGMYSPTRRTMFVVTDVRDRGDLQAEVTAVHEMVHALQHQHFEQTVALLRGLRRNDDLISAISASMEGDAFLSMFDDSPNSYSRSVAGAKQLRGGMLADLQSPDGALASVPRLMQVSLVFPYAHGVVIAARAYGGERCSSWLPTELWAPAWCRGNHGLDRMLRSPPLSSAQVLFPERKEPVEFVALPLLALQDQVENSGCSLGLDNVVGSLTLGVLLEEFGVSAEEIRSLSSELSGDRFVHVRCPESREFAWLSRWSNPEFADRFATVYETIAPAVATGRLAGAPEVHTAGRTVLVLTPGLRESLELLLDGSEIRAFSDLQAWIDAGCFPESPCPFPVPAVGAGRDPEAVRLP